MSTSTSSDAAPAVCSRQQPDSSSGKRCLPCEGGLPAVTPERLKEGLESLPLWAQSEDGTKISRAFVAKNFVEALAFFNAVGAVAEREGVCAVQCSAICSHSDTHPIDQCSHAHVN